MRRNRLVIKKYLSFFVKLGLSVFPDRKLSKVVLPAPDAPIIANISPEETFPETSLSKI